MAYNRTYGVFLHNDADIAVSSNIEHNENILRHIIIQ